MIKLYEDGSNWSLYRIQLYLELEGHGLSRHMRGTVLIPVTILKYGGCCYGPWDTYLQYPLTNEAVDIYENQLQEFCIQEAKGSAVLENSLPTIIYQRIMRLNTLYDKLNMLDFIFPYNNPHARRRIQNGIDNARYDGGLLRNHVFQMMEYRDELLDYGYIMDDAEYVDSLKNSFEGYPWYQLMILRAAAHTACFDAYGRIDANMINAILLDSSDQKLACEKDV